MRKAIAREHDVTATTDPRDALAKLDDGAVYDVIFCDVMMPHLNGEDVLVQISERHPAMASRVVFVTGGATNADIEQFLAQLSNDVIDKPFSMVLLLDLARNYVQRHAAD
jgi:CheY-like chemotaxis protein